MSEKFTRYDSAEYLKTEDDIAAYIEACMDDGGEDPAFIAQALGVAARAQPDQADARSAGLTQADERRRVHIPQRSEGVCTGASHSASMPASAAVTVIEQPAISSDVT